MSLQITQGTGTTIDTRQTATNSYHRQVIVIGDPSVDANVAPVDVTNGLAVQVKTIASGAAFQILDSGGANKASISAGGAVKVDGSAVTQPVTANAGTNLNTSLLALESGGNLATVAGAVTASKMNVLLAAGTNLVGQISASGETSTIYNGTTALTPTFANLTASASGVTTLISAVASKRIRIIALSLIANAGVNVKFQSHVAPTDISGLYYLAANAGFVLPYNPVGWFQTIAGEAFDINLSGAVAVGGSIVYVTV